MTLTEMLVIIVVLGVLIMLLLPALLQRPAGGPTCPNNMKWLTLATLDTESAQRRFPGYVSRITTRPDGSALVGSWVVGLLPYMERNDLWQRWKQGNPVVVQLSHLTCPYNPPPANSTAPVLAYVANCGLPGDNDTAAEGVFHNHAGGGQPVSVTLDYIISHDGSANTLMFSENLQAGYWNDTTEANLGMVWFREPGPSSGINQGKDVGPRPQDIPYARPSSRHPGIVHASFCDGSVRSLSDQIDYSVFQHLMTPDGKKAGLEGELEPDAF
jgi:Protein of unknown function (DUF1559)